MQGRAGLTAQPTPKAAWRGPAALDSGTNAPNDCGSRLIQKTLTTHRPDATIERHRCAVLPPFH